MGNLKLCKEHIETLRNSINSVDANTRAAIKRVALAQARCPRTRYSHDVARAGFFMSAGGIVSVASGVRYTRFDEFVCAEIYKNFGTNEYTGVNDTHIASAIRHLITEDDFNAI